MRSDVFVSSSQQNVLRLSGCVKHSEVLKLHTHTEKARATVKTQQEGAKERTSQRACFGGG